MKIAKKTLSIFLSLLMIFGACSVGLTGMTITAAAATGTVDSVKNALTDFVANEIVYKGTLEHNSYTYKGDADVVLAADEIYAYAMSLRMTGITDTQNSTAGLLDIVAKNTGFTSGVKYTALQYILDPPGDTISAIELVTPANGGECNGCDHKYVYNEIPCSTPELKTVKVQASVNSLMSKYNSVNDIPSSLLQGVEYRYAHKTDQASLDGNEHKSGCDTVYDCMGYRWNYLRSVHRSEIKNIVSIDELKEFGKTLASADLSMTFDEMIALDAAELQAIYDENYGPYQAMIDKYTFANVKKLFGSYNTYFDNLLKAMQINLAMPAIDILMEKVGTAYDSSNYNEMAAIYSPANSAYNVVKGLGSDVFDYIKTKDEYKDFDKSAAYSYIEELKYNMDLIKLPDLKAAIAADLAVEANQNAVANINDVTNPATNVLTGLRSKFGSYQARVNASNSRAVTVVMQNEKVALADYLAKLDAKIALRADTEAAFKGQYEFFTPILFGDYAQMDTDSVISMYNDYDANLTALTDSYNELVAKHGATVVDPLFKVTLGEGGTPTLLQNAVSSMKSTAQNSMKAELVARNHDQLVIAAGYKDMAASINMNNFMIVGTAVKNFDQNLYDFLNHADRNWVPAADQTIYSDVSAIITAYNNFVNTVNNSGYQKIELDENGVYVVRDVYETDLVKDEAYEVTTQKLNDTIVKLDNFLASEDFGALLGFEDADGNAVGLGDYLYNMIGGLLFNNDLVNMIVGMLFPMIEDLLMTMIPDLLNGEDVNPDKIPPDDRGAVGYVAIGALLDGAEGGIDVYLNDINFTGQKVKQQTYEQLLNGAGLKIFPKIFADSMVSSGVITTASETYKMLAAAGASWTNLGVFDPETETYSYAFDFDWGITDKASFIKAFGGVLDSIKPLLPTAFLNQALDLNLGNSDSSPAGVGYGSIKYSIVSISNHEFYASLPISLQPLNLYATVLQPLFKALGLNANASLSSNSKGIDYANAVFGPIFELLDKVAEKPLDTILSILPSLADILATGFVDELLGKIVIDVSVSLKILGSDDGTFDTLAGLLGSLLTFELFGKQLGIADIAGAATIEALLGVDIRDINALLDFVFEKLDVALDLPDIDQAGLMQCGKWNSAHNLTADKADVLFFLLDYIVSALDTDFINSIIGLIGGEDSSLDLEGTLGTVLNTVVGNIANNPDDVIAALVELLNPVTYELEEMTWAEGTDESVVYLHYANDWTKSESQYLIDNAMTIVSTVLAMTGSEVTDINAFLNEKVNGLFETAFTNETITKLVETFATMDPLADILNDILVEQLGVNMGAWANDFGYLFNEELAAPETTVLGVTAVKDEEGNIVWNGLVDGDKAAFIDTLCAVLAPFAPAVAWLFGGKDLGVFDVVELKGYASFDSTLGALLETLGVDVPAVDFANAPMDALNTVVDSVFTWLDATLASDNLAEIAVNAVADLLWYIESDGLTVLINNLLMPVLALVDTVRPLIDVDVNTIISVVVSDLINGNGFSFNKILDLVFGTFEGNDDILVTVTIDKLSLTDVLAIADTIFGSDLVHSSLVTIGLKGICNADLDAADALTIILSSLIDCLGQPAADASKTNAQAIFGFIEEKTGKEITHYVTAILDLIEGVVYEYSAPNWGYMFGLDEEFNTVLPKHSIVYLDYKTDWTEETADAVYDSLEGIVEMVFDTVPALQGKTITTLVNGLLEDNVYSDEILNTIVQELVKLLANLDATLFTTVDVVLDTDISEWFSYCDITYGEDGKVAEVVCTKDWGVDEAEDKKATFIAAIKEVLTPANRVLAWLFFEDSYEFLTDSEKDAEGNYTYNSLITLNGGAGYAKALVPLFEALGCEMKPASAYLVNGEYDVPAAVEDIFNAALALVDKVSAAPAEEVFKLLPNILYFINADGAKVVVNNLLAPVNAILEKLTPMVGDISIGGLLADAIGFDITDITMDTLLGLAGDYGFVMSDKHVNIIKTFYVGELEAFTSANGDLAYRMVYTDEESAADMLTIILSLALELFKLNEELFASDKLLGKDIYDAIMTIMTGYTGEFVYADPNWAYMYGGDIDKLIAENLPAPSDVYLGYANDWTELTAETLSGNLGALVNAILKMTGNDSTVGAMIQSAIAGNLFKDEIVNKLLVEIVKLLAGLDTSVVKAAGAALGADLDVWFEDFCDITRDEDGKVTDVVCTKDWGIDEAEDKAAAFADAFETALAPANRLLAWLLFGQDYTFFNGSNNDVLITIKGGEGYNYALVPLLEALGCTVNGADYYNNNAAAAIGDVITAICDKIDELCNGDTVDTVIGMLPNIIYFVSAGGAKTVVNNLVQPVMFLLEALKPVGVNLDLVELIGFDIFNLDWDAIFGILEDKLGVTLTADAEALIKNFYIGSVEEKTSANGRQYFYMTADATAKRDMITIILSVALETLLLDSNKTVFVDLMGEDIYNTIVTVIAGAQADFEYADPNWAYMYEGEDALAQLIANNLPERTEENKIMYTLYTNNWNKETADYIAANLSTIVNAIISGMSEEGSTVGTMLEAAINGNLYKDSVLDSVLAAVVKLLAGLDYTLVDSVGALLSADVDAWFDFCEITRDEEGKVIDVVCTKDWGIDEAEDKAKAFVDAFVTALTPANRVLAWLFFGQDYTFLNNANGDNLITISGGNGYAEGLAPLLSALGCEVKPATAYVNGDKVDMTAAVRDVFTALCDRITDVCSDDAIDVVLELLPNLIYFINADGAKVVVNNLLQPAYFLLEKLSPLVGDINLDELVGFPISDIDFDAIFKIVGDEFGIYFPEKIQKFITSFYLGEVEKYTGANGEAAFRMVYSETETSAEMLTILVSLVIDVFRYEDNAKAFADLLGEDVYNAIMSVLELECAKPMQEFNWLYTEYADTDKTFTPVETTQIYTATYNQYWTKDKAQYLADHAGEFILNILHVLNLEINGVKISDIETLINTLLSDLYSQANADAILNLVKDLVSKLEDLEPYGDLIKNVAKSALGVDLTVYDSMTVTVEDGNRDSFEAAIGQMLAPVVPVLEILLTSKDVSFFLDIEGADAITIFGSEGYAYGIIPLLEALGCDSVLTPAEYKAAIAADPAAAITSIIDPLFDRIDEIAADPVNEVLELLPAVIYFVNSNGLDTAVKNVVNSIDTVLVGLEPLVGVTSVVDLLGVDLKTYNFDYLFDMLIGLAADSGFELTEIAGNAINELTIGRVVSYQSKNGETYYTMQYASDRDKADMVTVLLRLVVDFVTKEENLAVFKDMLADVIVDEDTHKSVCAILDSVAAAVNEDPNLGKGMAVVFYLFLALDKTAEGADDIYHDVTNSWEFILHQLATSDDPALRNFEKTLKATLNKYFDTDYEVGDKENILDEEKDAGTLSFFDAIKNFFQKIAEFFRKLFGMA